MAKKKDDLSKMDRWIKDTQLFQRIAGTPESPYEDLAKEWGTFKGNARKD